MAATGLFPTEEISRRGAAWYEQLRPRLEAEHLDRYVAIDVATGAFAVADSTAKAAREMHSRDPDTSFYIRRIGNKPEPELAARLFGPTLAPARERK